MAYPYLGNVAGHPAEDTYCHACGERVIWRRGMGVARLEIDAGRCRHCGTVLPGRFAGDAPPPAEP